MSNSSEIISPTVFQLIFTASVSSELLASHFVSARFFLSSLICIYRAIHCIFSSYKSTRHYALFFVGFLLRFSTLIIDSSVGIISVESSVPTFSAGNNRYRLNHTRNKSNGDVTRFSWLVKRAKKTPLNRTGGKTMVAEATIVFASFAVGKHFAQLPSCSWQFLVVGLNDRPDLNEKEINSASTTFTRDQN